MSDEQPAEHGSAGDEQTAANRPPAPDEAGFAEADADASVGVFAGADPLADEIAEFWESARPHVDLAKVGVITGVGTAALAPPVWSFGGTPEEADQLLEAVLVGDKRATTSVLEEYGDEPLPEAGDLSIIVDGAGHPRALIRTTSVEVVRFADVDEEFAAAEGEGDRTLAAWRADHRAAIARTLGSEPDDDTLVVCERFELRYPGSKKNVWGSPLI